MKTTLRTIEAALLFGCNTLGLYAYTRLQGTPDFDYRMIALGIAGTIVLMVASNASENRRLIYSGAILALPLILGKSVLQWSIKYYYTKIEYILSELKRVEVPRMSQYTLDVFKTTTPTLNTLIIALTLTTIYIALSAHDLIKKQYSEFTERQGTPQEINNTIRSHLAYQSQIILKTIITATIPITASEYLNTAIQVKLQGILSIIPAIIGVILFILTIKRIEK